MTSIGETLRQERLKRDLDLEQISRELKISSRFLEAIEDERFEKLPGGVFAKSFVRQYAQYLGLDEGECAAAVQQVVEPHAALPTAAPLSLPRVDIALPRVEEWQSIGERRFNWSNSLPALALVVIAMLVCSGIYAWWQRSRHTAQNRDEKPQVVQMVHSSQPAAPAQPSQVTPPPAASAAETQAPPQTNAAGDAAPTSAAAAPASASGAPASPPGASPTASASRPAPETAAPANAVPEGATQEAGVKVEISATDPVWVSAKADGKYLFSGTLEANQKRSLEAKTTLVLRLGNAGGASITLNGKPIGPVGPKGQVRTVQFTSGGFQIVAAPKPSLPSDPL
jgi:cytoskeleton protein RodZ